MASHETPERDSNDDRERKEEVSPSPERERRAQTPPRTAPAAREKEEEAATPGAKSNAAESQQQDQSKAGGSTQPSEQRSRRGAGRSPKRSLETVDPLSIPLKELKERARHKTGRGPLTGAAFALFDSPRTLQALAEEGVDPLEQLAQRQLSDFLAISKGDVACAEIRLRHYESKRKEVLDALRSRRQRIIERQNEQHQQEEQSLRRPARTPIVQPTEELTGTHPPPGAQASQKRDRSHTGTAPSAARSTRSESPAESESHSRARRSTRSSSMGGSDVVGDPEEYRRRAADAKKAKVLRQAQKMREVMEANARREKQKQEVLAKLMEQREEREQELERKRRKQELDRRVKEAAAVKHEAELLIQREKRELALLHKQEELQRQREEKMKEFEEKEREREEEERRQAELEAVKRMRKRRKVALRYLAIKEFADRITEEQKEKLLNRMDHADHVREELTEKRHEELEQRQEENRLRTLENRRKRQQAEERFLSKITRYKEKSAAAEAHRAELEKEQQDYFLLRSLQEKEKDKQRKALTACVRQQEREKCLQLLQELEAAEAHAKEVHEKKMAEARLRAAEKDIVLEDRRLNVRRMQRMIENSILEAEAKYEAKMERIQALQKDAAEADKQRRLLQYKSLQQGMELAKQNKNAAKLYEAPGPLDYNAVAADRWVHGTGPTVKMGPATHKSRKVDLSPGPGSYGSPFYPKRIKGGVLPPKEDLALAELIKKKQEAAAKARAKSKSPEKKRARTPDRGGDGKLPSIYKAKPSESNQGTKPRSETAPPGANYNDKKATKEKESPRGRGSNSQKASAREGAPAQQQSHSSNAHVVVDRPEELSDADFDSSDEFDSGSSSRSSTPRSRSRSPDSSPAKDKNGEGAPAKDAQSPDRGEEDYSDDYASSGDERNANNRNVAREPHNEPVD
jgi:hypothetical protein